MDMIFPRGRGTQLKKLWKFQGIGGVETVKPPGTEQNPGRWGSNQEPITRSVQLPYKVCDTAFSHVELFLN